MPRLPAGKFRERFIVEKHTTASGAADAAGHINEADTSKWVTYCERRGAIVPQASREFREATQINANITGIVKFRYDRLTKNITSTMRLKKLGESRLFGIEGVFNVNEEDHTIQILYKERI